MPVDLAVVFNGKTWIKCHYKRQSIDTAPEWACPSCGVAYVKAEAASREEQEQLNLQNRIERVDFVKANQPVDKGEVVKIKSEKSMANLIYILFFTSILGGITGLGAIVSASAKGFQNRSLNDALISFFSPFMLIGLAIIVISSLWFWYCMIKGCIVLSRDETVGDFFDASI